MQQTRKRVVITGMGTVNPVGNTLAEYWDGIKNGKSGIGPITRFDPKDHTTKIAAEIKNFKASERMDPKDARKMETFSHYAVASAIEAWENTKLGKTGVDPERLGVILGVGMGGEGDAVLGKGGGDDAVDDLGAGGVIEVAQQPLGFGADVVDLPCGAGFGDVGQHGSGLLAHPRAGDGGAPPTGGLAGDVGDELGQFALAANDFDRLGTPGVALLCQ